MAKKRQSKKDIEIIPIEDTKPEYEASMSVKDIYVYKGTLPAISYMGQQYERDVPTHFRKCVLDRFKNKEDFELYDPKCKDYNRSKLPIAVFMPHKERNAICSMTTLNRIKERFPSSDIIAYCNPAHRDILPKGIQFGASRNGQERFYRAFDITENAISRKWLHLHNETFIPIHKLILDASGLGEIEDKGIPVTYYDRPLGKPEGYTLYCDESDFSKAVQQSFDFNSTNPLKPNKTSRGVIFTYDSPLCYYYLFLGIPVLMFFTPNDLNHQFQYKLYKSAQPWAMPKEGDFDKAIGVVKDFLGSEPKSKPKPKSNTIDNNFYGEPIGEMQRAEADGLDSISAFDDEEFISKRTVEEDDRFIETNSDKPENNRGWTPK